MFPITLIYGCTFLNGDVFANLEAVGLLAAEEVVVA
jgi:hypothetical protein